MIARANNADIIAGLSLLRMAAILGIISILLSFESLIHTAILLGTAGTGALVDAFIYRKLRRKAD